MKTGMKLVVVALVLALAVPAAASAKKVIYGGTIDGTQGNGRIAFTVKTGEKKKPKFVKAVRYIGVPHNCEMSGTVSTGVGGAREGRIPVVKRKFELRITQPSSGLVTTIDGKFSSKKKLTGSMDYHSRYPADPNFDPPLPEENCHAQVTYKAKRGGQNVVLPSNRLSGRTR